jgi:hypothetical protein
MFPAHPVPDRFLGNSNRDAASWFRSYERMIRSRFSQLICRFITNNALMAWHPYQLYPVMSRQLHEGLMGHPVPGGYKYGDLALHVGEVSNLGQ